MAVILPCVALLASESEEMKAHSNLQGLTDGGLPTRGLSRGLKRVLYGGV